MVKNSNNLLFQDISQLIESAKNHVARSTNSTLVHLYWCIGNRINQDILKNERAGYGENIIENLSEKLTVHYGKGFNVSSLFKMIRFFRRFPDKRIVSTLWTLFSWSHFRELIELEDPLKREFYTEMCRIEHWSVRELRAKIDSMLYERTAISHQPEKVIQQDLATLRFRDPYILDFLSLPSSFSESNLEHSILEEMCRFLEELGNDFCFIGRQKRITIDNDDYYIDLLTYHRSLRRLVAIELKLAKFNASYKGQMELYLNWLNKHERKKGENKPLGLILCAEKKQEHIELLELNKSQIHVAQYLTQLPPKELLEKQLRKAINIAQEKLR